MTNKQYTIELIKELHKLITENENVPQSYIADRLLYFIEIINKNL